ncbi:MAG: hypothetical protein AB8B57_01400 [Congregibacter sp.]
MTTTDDRIYDIYFAGECLDGHAESAVKSALGQLFQADEQTLARLFSGKQQRIKKGCDKAAALRYQAAMKAAGARIAIVSATPEMVSATPEMVSATVAALEPLASETAAAIPANAAAGLSLSPPESDVLRPDERPVQAQMSIDLSHLSVAAVGESLSENSATATNEIAAPDLELAAVGSMLSDAAADIRAPEPDSSSLTLAPADHDFSDCSVPVTPNSELSTEHMQLAEIGSDLSSGAPPGSELVDAPDTSHITLEDPTDRGT